MLGFGIGGQGMEKRNCLGVERVEIADGLDVEVRESRTLQCVGLRSWEVLYRDEGHRRGTCLWVG